MAARLALGTVKRAAEERAVDIEKARDKLHGLFYLS